MRKGTIVQIVFIAFLLSFLVLINEPSQQIMDRRMAFWLTIGSVFLSFIFFIVREIRNGRAQAEFFTIITHKFRTPLTGIRWAINLLQKDLPLTEKGDLLMEIQKANERLLEIVDLVVGFAKFDKRLEYAFEAVSLREVVSASLNKYSALIRSKEISFHIDSDRELPMLSVDRSKIQFVVDMLVENAIKYTSKKSSVEIGFVGDDRSLTLSVKDAGIGMSFLDSKMIFRKFFRSRQAKLMDTEGLGLGLYTARKIADRHGGKLWCSSKGLGQGSTFYLRLPIKK